MAAPDDLMQLAQRVSQLERRNRRLNLVLFGMLLLAVFSGVAGLVGAGTTPSKPAHESAGRVEKFDEITVGRINIAGPDHINRLILSYKMPQAPFQGELVERSVPPGMAGMIYCAPNGDEVGGIGVSGSEKGGTGLITLDYRNTPLEAIGLGTQYGPKGQSAGFAIMESPAGPVNIRKIKSNDETEVKRLQAMMIERISLGLETNKSASLVIRDRQGKDRIVIGVDENNKPEVKILDENGKETGRLPTK